MRNSTMTTIAAVLAVAGLAACSSSRPSEHPASTGAISASPGGVTARMSQHPLPPDSAFVNDLNKRKAVTVSECGQTAGGWGASGTVSNPSKQSTDYKIAIFFTTDHATVLDYATTKVTASAGAVENWTASAKFSIPTGTAMHCVLRSVS